MRRVLLALFLIFYAASSAVITAERTTVLVTEWQHASGLGNDVQVKDGCLKLRDGYPNYREAKRASLDFEFRPALAGNFLPAVTSRQFPSYQIHIHSYFTVPISPTRAPPQFS
jgi:hypothetical protein